MDGAINWEELLPGRVWKKFTGENWADLMPPPSPQPSHLLPQGFGGCCGLHSFSEVLTVILRRIVNSDKAVCVDLPELIQVCLEKGVLLKTGTSSKRIGDFLDSNAVPIQGSLPEQFVLSGDWSVQVEDHLQEICAKGIKLITKPAVALPVGTPTAELAEAAMAYREQLCSVLNLCPVVISLPLQEHYAEVRPQGVPYRQIEGAPYVDSMPWYYFGLLGKQPIYHSVTAFGYECPSGDVRSLELHYQENASIGSGPGRYVMDPDAVLCYYLPLVSGLYFQNKSAPYQDEE